MMLVCRRQKILLIFTNLGFLHLDFARYNLSSPLGVVQASQLADKCSFYTTSAPLCWVQFMKWTKRGSFKRTYVKRIPVLKHDIYQRPHRLLNIVLTLGAGLAVSSGCASAAAER